MAHHLSANGFSMLIDHATTSSIGLRHNADQRRALPHPTGFNLSPVLVAQVTSVQDSHSDSRVYCCGGSNVVQTSSPSNCFARQIECIARWPSEATNPFGNIHKRDRSAIVAEAPLHSLNLEADAWNLAAHGE